MNPRLRKVSWRRKWLLTPVLLLGESHGQRSTAGYSPWGCKESDMTKHSTARGKKSREKGGLVYTQTQTFSHTCAHTHTNTHTHKHPLSMTVVLNLNYMLESLGKL